MLRLPARQRLLPFDVTPVLSCVTAALCLVARNYRRQHSGPAAAWCCPTALWSEVVLVQCTATQGYTAGTLHPSLLPDVL